MNHLERHIKDLVPEYPVGMRQEVEDESSPNKRKDTTSKQRVNVVPDSSDEESSDRDHHFKRDRKRNRRSPSPVKGNIEIPVSEEVESSNKMMTGSETGENEHSINALVQGSPKPQSSHDEPQTDPMDRPEVSIFDGKNLESFESAFANLQKLDIDNATEAKDELKNAQDEVAQLKKRFIKATSGF
nr:hypothetical protein Itr_chr08CG14230 [Ipomoea trifida]